MSKVAIQGNATGTGVFTLASPATNTDRTLTLPDEAGTVIVDESNSGAVKVDSAGNLGLGVTPSAWGGTGAKGLQVGTALALGYSNATGSFVGGNAYYSSSGWKRITTGAATAHLLGGDGSHIWYNTSTSSTADSAISFTQAMTLDSSGNLLVGTATTPSSSGIGIGFQPGYSTSGTSMVTRSNTTSANDVIYFYNPNGLVGYVRTSGSSTSYVTSSDYRLKENVVGVTGASARVQQLNPVRFNFIADPDTTVDGFLAHEVQDVVPEAITGTKDATAMVDIQDEDGNVTGQEERPVYQGIDQSKLVPLLTAALQEALTKIETLEARVAALEGN